MCSAAQDFDGLLGLDSQRVRGNKAEGHELDAGRAGIDMNGGLTRGVGKAGDGHGLPELDQRLGLGGQQVDDVGVLWKVSDDNKELMATRFGRLFPRQSPAVRKQQLGSAKGAGSLRPAVDERIHGEGIARNQFAAIGERAEFQTCGKLQGPLDALKAQILFWSRAIELRSAGTQSDRAITDVSRLRGGFRKILHGTLRVEGKNIVPGGEQQGINFPGFGAVFIDEPLRQNLRIERLAIFAFYSDGAAQKGGVQESGDALGAMVYERVQANLTPGFAVERRDVV